MAGIGIGIEEIEVLNDPGAERIEMNVPNQFEQVRFLFAENGFIAVLEKMAGSFVTLVERHGIAGKKASHDARYRRGSGPKEKMGVVREQGEGIAGGLLFGEYLAGPVDKAIPVDAVVKDRAPCDASDHQMVHRAWGVYAGMSRHKGIVSAKVA